MPFWISGGRLDEVQCMGRRIQVPMAGSKMTTVARMIEELRSRGGLKATDVANIASVSPTAVSRWIAGKALPDPQTQLVISDLRYVADRLSEFYTPDEIR